VTKGRGSGQPAPFDSLLWPAHISVAGMVLLKMSFAVVPCRFSLFLSCSGSFLLFVSRVVFHGWRSRVRPHVSAASFAAAAAPAREPVARSRASAAGASPPLFGVISAPVTSVLVLVHPLFYGQLHVLVLGHRLRVLLRLCFGLFLLLLLPCLWSCIGFFMGGCTCSCSGTGWGCFSAVVWGGFSGLLLPCSWSSIRCFMGGCTCSCSGTGWGCSSAFVWCGFSGLLLPCSWSSIRCFMGGRTCSCSGTGWGCSSAFVYGGFLGLLPPCSCSCIRCFMGGCTCSCSDTGRLCFSVVLRSDYAPGASVLQVLYRLLPERLQVR